MMTGPEPLFRDLEPPPGGEARLRHALARVQTPAGNPAITPWVGAAGSAAVLALLLAVGLPLSGRDSVDKAGDAVRTVLAAPAGGFQSHTARIVERRERAGPVRLYVLMPPEDTQDAGG